MRVTPPTVASPQATITLSTRFARHSSDRTLSSEGTPVFDVRKVNLPIILLALSLRDANKPSRDWHRDVVWPSALEVAAFSGGPEGKGENAQLMPDIDENENGDENTSPAPSSRTRRRHMVHPYDGQPYEVRHEELQRSVPRPQGQTQRQWCQAIRPAALLALDSDLMEIGRLVNEYSRFSQWLSSRQGLGESARRDAVEQAGEVPCAC